MSNISYDAARHYDRVTAVWSLLLGEDLHYGVFVSDAEELGTATQRLTQRMLDAAEVEPGMRVLDIGCGTGSPACLLARDYGARVCAITTSSAGVKATRSRAQALGVEKLVQAELRDGTETGLPDEAFDRVWVLESSHLMRDRERLVAECSRLLAPFGRLVLCDIVLRRPMPLAEVRRLREPLMLLREVFGDARMEPLSRYVELASKHGLKVNVQLDLTDATRPTFARWRRNAQHHRDAVIEELGEDGHRKFVAACDVLGELWDDGTLGYGLLSADKRTLTR